MTVSAFAGGEAAMAAAASSAANALLRDRIMTCSSSFLDLRTIVAGDLGAGRLPPPRVSADVGERGLEGIDAVRHAGEIGVQRNRHDPSRFRALAIEHVELPADHLAEFIGGAVRALEHRLVVDLVAIGHGDETAATLEAHRIGLVVISPVAHILATFGSEEVERVPGLLQTGAEPADRARAAGLGDGRERALDDPLFLAGRRFVEAPGIAFAMPHPFPAELLALGDDFGMVRAEVAVERDG